MRLRSALRSGDEARLATAIEAAKRDSVPKLVLDKALAGQTSGAADECVLVEASAPGGVLLVVRALTANRSALMHEIRRCINQHEVGTLSAALWAFQKECSFAVSHALEAQPQRLPQPQQPQQLPLDRDALELLAIEHGADDVQSLDGDEHTSERTLIVCVGEDAEHRIGRLLSELAAAAAAASGSSGHGVTAPPPIETSYRPTSPVSLEDMAALDALTDLVSDLSEIDGVEQVFTNLSYE
jgi:transcriptional/translational regulatory protein YebC/TACO1